MKQRIAEFSLSNFQTISENILPSLIYVIRTSNAFARERETILKMLSNLSVGSSVEFSLLPLLQMDIREVDSTDDFDLCEQDLVHNHEDESTQVSGLSSV